jgi:hypothetical protein
MTRMNNQSGFDMGAMRELMKQLSGLLDSGNAKFPELPQVINDLPPTAGQGRGARSTRDEALGLASQVANQIGNQGGRSRGGIVDSLVGAKPIADNERPRYGIDPRDPNRYSVGSNGELIGTLMGWNSKGNNSDIFNRLIGGSGLNARDIPRTTPAMKPSPSITTMIPRASRPTQGMTRLSPGVYRDTKGQLVNNKGGLIRK